ncbi:MAG: hypothetical protein KAJ03_11030 [Gammaproteobacteria bacterium]|nr:hypothetical protein [Gammaproteobacteria bacterium]
MGKKKPENIEPDIVEDAELNEEMQILEELPEESEPEAEQEETEEVKQSEKEVPEPEPKQTAPKPDKINALVKCCFIETRDGINAKKGDTIEIPTDPKKHSPALELAIKTGNVVVDLAPVVSKDAEA